MSPWMMLLRPNAAGAEIEAVEIDTDEVDVEVVALEAADARLRGSRDRCSDAG